MMKFDADSINQRITYNLNEDPNWSPSLNNSVIASLIRHNSEADAEISRYGEYLFNESRWDTAQNRSSVVSLANMLGYQPKRKISGRGKLYVSLDPKIAYVGSTLTLETFQNLEDPASRNASIYNMWTRPQAPIKITPSCVIKDYRGVSYIVTSPIILEEGRCYASVDVVQGVRKTKFLNIQTIRKLATRSKLNKCLYIPVRIQNCEAAENIASRGLLNVYVQKKYGDETILDSYRVVDSLLLSSDGDQDVEFYNDPYNQEIFYLKFKDDPSRGGYVDISSNTSVSGIRIDYVESLGSQSNVSDLYKSFYIDNATVSGSSSKVRLYGINYTPIEGGQDEETVLQIKSNATKEYVKHYGVATKENYQKVIMNTSFPIEVNGEGQNLVPKKVQVYGGYEEKGNMKYPVTKVSFIGANLEDMVFGKDKNSVCDSISKSMNYALSRLKSPQDTIRFVPPVYTAFALGLTCTLKDSSDASSQLLSTEISDFIDSRWSPNSNDLDFERNFFKSEELSLIMQNFTNVKSISMEVEAVKKLDWFEAERMNPWKNQLEESTVNMDLKHTCRIPFSFSTVFKGAKTNGEGFKDYNVSAPYVMRIDFLWKTPKNMGGNVGLNRSLFIDSASVEGSRSKMKFFKLSEGQGQEYTWPEVSDLIQSFDYNELGDADMLDTSYMVDFKKKVYSDSDYALLKKDILSGKVATRTSSSKGTIDNYLVYFSGDYTTESIGNDNIGAGWLEFSFSEIYNVLREYALYDPNVLTALNRCPLSLLECDTSNSEVFQKFVDLASNYLDIYVCMRPNDDDLKLQLTTSSKESGFNGSNEVLYIDTYDAPITDGGSTTAQTTNLTSEKRARFISVDCSSMDF